MCTVTKIEPTLQKAEEDIICYKRADISRKPASWFMRYILRKRYKIEINSLLYSYRYKLGKTHHTHLDEFVKDGEFLFSGKGFYSYSKPVFDYNVKCIIPKGTKYYAVEDIENISAGLLIYTSEAIKIVEILI